MTRTAEELVAAGEPQAALAVLQAQIRVHASDAKLRVFLFQLLCVLGQWDRALKQLDVCGEMDDANLAMVATYRDAVQSEPLRTAVFEGRTTPMVIGRPDGWLASLIEALRADGRGDPALASRLRADALDAAVPTSGRLNDEPFAWIADADPRLGPVLEAVIEGQYRWVPFEALSKVVIEAPADLRDLVWAPAHLTLTNGAELIALLPVRYPALAPADESLLLARGTDWLDAGDGRFHGVGQRLFVTDAAEVGLLEVRELTFDQPAPSIDGPAG